MINEKILLLKKLQNILKNKLVICIGLPSQELYKINDKPNFLYLGNGFMLSIGLGLISKEDIIS